MPFVTFVVNRVHARARRRGAGRRAAGRLDERPGARAARGLPRPAAAGARTTRGRSLRLEADTREPLLPCRSWRRTSTTCAACWRWARSCWGESRRPSRGSAGREHRAADEDHPVFGQGRRRARRACPPPPRCARPRSASARWSSPPTPRTAWPTRSSAEVGGEPTQVAPSLDALEIDVNRELAEPLGRDPGVADALHDLPGRRRRGGRGDGHPARHGGAVQPAARSSASPRRGAYDVVVIDCAPTGETVRMLGVPEILNFYFKRIFPIQRTVLRSVRPVAKRVTDMPLPSDDVFAAVKTLYERARGHGAAAPGPEAQLDPHRAEPRAHGHQRVAAALHLPEPLRLPRGRGDRQPRAAAGGALAVLRPLVRHPGRPPGGGPPARSSRCPSSRRASSTARWSGLPLLDEFGREVFGERDPTAVFFEEKPVEVKKEGAGYALYIRLPFAEKDRIQVWTKGDELVVRWTTSGGTCCCRARWPRARLVGAAFAEQRLRVALRREGGPMMPSERHVEEGLLPGLGDPRGDGPRPGERCAGCGGRCCRAWCMLCQWQLERMERPAARREGRRQARAEGHARLRAGANGRRDALAVRSSASSRGCSCPACRS